MKTKAMLTLVVGVVAMTGCGSSSNLMGAAPAESVVSAPLLLNGEQVAEAIEAEYPERHRADGVGGTVRLRLLVGSDGIPAEVRLLESSGYPELDAAATRVAVFLRFSPATNADGEPVRIWVAFPISFRVR